MALIYIVSDSPKLKNNVSSALAGPTNELVELSSGGELMELLKDESPDLVILDLQINNKGATAITLDMRLEEQSGRIPPTKVLVLLDRRADVFMTKRSAADGFLIKPFNSIKLRQAVNAILKEGHFHDSAYAPAN